METLRKIGAAFFPILKGSCFSKTLAPENSFTDSFLPHFFLFLFLHLNTSAIKEEEKIIKNKFDQRIKEKKPEETIGFNQHPRTNVSTNAFIAFKTFPTLFFGAHIFKSKTHFFTGIKNKEYQKFGILTCIPATILNSLYLVIHFCANVIRIIPFLLNSLSLVSGNEFNRMRSMYSLLKSKNTNLSQHEKTKAYIIMGFLAVTHVITRIMALLLLPFVDPINNIKRAWNSGLAIGLKNTTAKDGNKKEYSPLAYVMAVLGAGLSLSITVLGAIFLPHLIIPKLLLNPTLSNGLLHGLQTVSSLLSHTIHIKNIYFVKQALIGLTHLVSRPEATVTLLYSIYACCSDMLKHIHSESLRKMPRRVVTGIDLGAGYARQAITAVFGGLFCSRSKHAMLQKQKGPNTTLQHKDDETLQRNASHSSFTDDTSSGSEKETETLHASPDPVRGEAAAPAY